jgi:hypothetical protein
LRSQPRPLGPLLRANYTSIAPTQFASSPNQLVADVWATRVSDQRAALWFLRAPAGGPALSVSLNPRAYSPGVAVAWDRPSFVPRVFATSRWAQAGRISSSRELCYRPRDGNWTRGYGYPRVSYSVDMDSGLKFYPWILSGRVPEIRRVGYGYYVFEREMCLWAISKYFGD